ncbi:MAG: hypothetical protein Kow0067_04930 [Coriobacteriia bacterium]
MPLTGRGGSGFSWRSAAFWASTWAIGAAIGAAIGGYLTLVSGSGAPGAQDLDPMTDLVVLPLAAFAVVFLVHLCVQLLAAIARGRRADAERDSEAGDQQPQGRDDSVGGEIGGEAPTSQSS